MACQHNDSASYFFSILNWELGWSHNEYLGLYTWFQLESNFRRRSLHLSFLFSCINAELLRWLRWSSDWWTGYLPDGNYPPIER